VTANVFDFGMRNRNDNDLDMRQRLLLRACVCHAAALSSAATVQPRADFTHRQSRRQDFGETKTLQRANKRPQ
jgi:hypothetical protein